MAVSSDRDTCAPLLTGGYDCDFVESPPESFQCTVCMLPFRDPTIPSCCGHKGCASCLGRIKVAGQPCPVCQQPFTTFLDKYFQRKVLDLRVYCSKKGDGCGWQGELRDLETHSRRDCGHVEEECRYKCGGRYQRRILHDHEMENCPQCPPEVITLSLVRRMAERVDKLEKVHEEDQIKLVTLQANLSDVQGKLAAVKKAYDEDQMKLAALEKAHHEDQVKVNQQIQDLQKENVTLQDEKEKLARKMAALG